MNCLPTCKEWKKCRKKSAKPVRDSRVIVITDAVLEFSYLDWITSLHEQYSLLSFACFVSRSNLLTDVNPKSWD